MGEATKREGDAAVADRDRALDPATLQAAPWLREAQTLTENWADGPQRPGRRLLRWIARLDRSAPVVGAPWCGLFVAHCLRVARPDMSLPTRQMQARPWLNVGRVDEPRLGAILVFWMLARWTGLGHVGFYWGEDETHFHVLGGNQRDRISVERWPRERLLGARWPDRVSPAATPTRSRDARAAEDFEFGDIF